jgi:hypothetical protein
MPLGIYISVPFCRTKCSYCNFASDVFSRAVFERYVDRVCADIKNAPQTAARWAGRWSASWIPSIWAEERQPCSRARNWSGSSLRCGAVRRDQNDAEVTVECAPGTLTPVIIESSAALRREPREPWSAVVCGPGSGGGWTPAQARDCAGGYCPAAGGGNYEPQHRSHRRAATPERRKLGILSIGNRRNRCRARQRLHARGG